jgi:VWFA-related protein
MRLLRSRVSRALLLAASLCTVSAHARMQGPPLQPEEGEVVRVNTEIVQTDVAVFDRQGRFVDDLKREQFDLRVDGAPVPVTFFERAGGGGQAGPPAASRAAGGRRLVIFLDDLHLSAGSVEHLRQALARFVDEEVRAGDEVAFVSASGQLGFLQQFTGHKSVMRAALARLRYQPFSARDTENPPMSEYVALRIATGDRDALNFYTNELLRSTQFQYSLPKYGGKGAGFLVGSEPEQIARVVMQRAEGILTQTTTRAAASLAALESFLRTAAQTPGRPLVLYLSDGLFMYDRGSGLERQMQRVTDAAARAGATLYAVDARTFGAQGADSRMRVDTTGRADRFSGDELAASRAALRALADNAGGRAIFDARDLDDALETAAAESARYYVLAWRPEGEGQRLEGFRRVEVGVAGRPDLFVRVRRGYLSEGARGAGDVRRVPVSVPAAARRELPTRVAVSFIDTPANGAVVTASAQVNLDAANFGAERRAAVVDVAGVFYDAEGKRVSSFQKRLSLDPPAAGAEGRASVIYNHRAPLAPGLYQVRVAARDERTGRAGTAAEWVEVPDLKDGRLTLSSLHLSEQAAGGGAADAPVQFSVERRFGRASGLSFLVVAYNAARGRAAPELTADIRVTRDGQTVLSVPTQKVPADASTDPARVPFGGSFPLRALRPGRHVLHVTLRDQRAGATATQEVTFEVE